MRQLWTCRNERVELGFYGEEARFWTITDRSSGREWAIGAPAFEMEGELIPVVLKSVAEREAPRQMGNGTTEYRVGGMIHGASDLRIDWIVRVPDNDNSVIRFRYELTSENGRRLTKRQGVDRLRYATLPLDDFPEAKELRFSEFMELVHSFCLTERPLYEQHFDSGQTAMGPLLTAGDGTVSALFAYEHGSQSPDAFIRYRLTPDRKVVLEAVKGNYLDGQCPDGERPYSTVWLQAALRTGNEAALASDYRSFVLQHQTLNSESRKPYIFYNTWNYQERNRNWRKKKYLDDMNLAWTLKEIDAAHEMGIDVYVLDTGWYEKTGDWRVSNERFPDGLKQVKERLNSYGMKLGLWFNPTVAAVSSEMAIRHPECVMSKGGEKAKPFEIWETEESLPFCLVSRYADAFADELIRLAKEVGVDYFKWDAIEQYGCEDPSHDHGMEKHSRQERADSYAFQQIQAMTRIVDKLCEACPEVIVDFDITEGGRSAGLAFLSAGKYFLVNNGPYYFNYDVPIDRETDLWNVFFYPGPARGWICRTPLNYDKWFPSVLFLTHYLPDDPRDNQLMSLGSLILGQNGIWGDLPAVSDEGRQLIGEVMALYKQIRDDITESDPVREGEVGGAPEVHEKLSARTGKGAVVIFSSTPGTYRYITRGLPDTVFWHTEGVSVTRDKSGHAAIEVVFETPSARFVLFGAGQSINFTN
ncbi:alpha-galactosidase [Cohnella silvisoli]|uniref:Alpha-galactosidase n=1 Tax=Cohnella silvisoli TaxID=2873699 RepID=A0ABV1KXN4_9BACL|nr:alpha-galactosidase [Cohnella silvisoli]MCD9023750.1 alpha-galactosidase [Cohnella silvisoli]